jgi:SAM-dependent methyltransferase
MSASEHPAVHEYILGADERERARLLMQSEIHRAQSERLLERFGVRTGGRVIDIGCGPLGVLDVLSTMVGRNGRAIGLDNEPRMIAHARRTIAEWDLTNVELVLADGGDTGIGADSLDLAHARLVLINHPAPQDIVGEMTRIVRPGGWVTIEEVDTLSWTCEPAHPAWTELLEASNGAWSAADQDPCGKRASVSDPPPHLHPHVPRSDRARRVHRRPPARPSDRPGRAPLRQTRHICHSPALLPGMGEKAG